MTLVRTPLQTPWYRSFACDSQGRIPDGGPAEAFQRDEEKTLLVTERIELGGGIVLLPGMRLRPEEAVWFLGQRWAQTVGAPRSQQHGAAAG